MGQGTGLELMKFMCRVSQVFGPEPAASQATLLDILGFQGN